MVTLTKEMQDALAKTELFPLATASKQGVPNVVPIRYLHVADASTLWITDNYFAKTLANLKENPQASLYVWPPDTQACLQLKGTAEIKTEGADYERMRALVHQKKPDLPAKSLVIFHITEVFDCLPGTTAGRKLL
jgi:predicted pyridoxine 5'-phosphate oxidase superfamily flavin-nucleotide-binding protein